MADKTKKSSKKAPPKKMKKPSKAEKKEMLRKAPSEWPIVVPTGQGDFYTLEKEDALLCIGKARHVGMDCKHRDSYRIQKHSLTSKKLFPQWQSFPDGYKPLIPFKGSPRALVSAYGKLKILIPKRRMDRGPQPGDNVEATEGAVAA